MPWTTYAALAEKLSIRFAGAGKLGVELVFDGVHFPEAGHRTFCAEMMDVLGEQSKHLQCRRKNL